MIIRLQQEPVATRWPCVVCGGRTEKHDVYAVLFGDDGTEEGHVCEECIKAGPVEMKRRAGKAVDHASNVAACHLHVAENILGTAVPTMTEWSEAQKKCDAFFLGEIDDLDLPSVHTPIVLPDGSEVPVMFR